MEQGNELEVRSGIRKVPVKKSDEITKVTTHVQRSRVPKFESAALRILPPVVGWKWVLLSCVCVKYGVKESNRTKIERIERTKLA